MALKQIRIGAVPDAYQYDDAVYPESMSVDSPVECTATPTDPDHLARLQDAGPQQLSVASLANPAAELGAIAAENGKTIICYKSGEFTIYAGSTTVVAADVPYIVTASGATGVWYAIAGKYSALDLILGGELYLRSIGKINRSGSDIYIESFSGDVVITTVGGNVASFDAGGYLIVSDLRPTDLRLSSATASQFAGFDASKNLVSVAPVTSPANATTSHDVTGTDTVDQATLESSLDSLGVTINNVISKLENIGIFV